MFIIKSNFLWKIIWWFLLEFNVARCNRERIIHCKLFKENNYTFFFNLHQGLLGFIFYIFESFALKCILQKKKIKLKLIWMFWLFKVHILAVFKFDSLSFNVWDSHFKTNCVKYKNNWFHACKEEISSNYEGKTLLLLSLWIYRIIIVGY